MSKKNVLFYNFLIINDSEGFTIFKAFVGFTY